MRIENTNHQQTQELSWPAQKLKTPASEISDNNLILSKKLDDAVKSFMGADYKDIDGYTLVVNGLSFSSHSPMLFP
ncbi:MAG: hypothetical protein KAI17_23015 [Thiotrichaceae bacterium]|nr:hypothetical protein [Thiotrichaceae bacterium]